MFNDEDETVVLSPFRNGEEAFEFMGSELYCKDAIDLEGDALLRYYAAQWADYQSASQLLNLICHHLNSDWVSRELAYGHMDIHFIYELAIVKWREIVFEPVHAKLNSAALKMIELGSKQGYCVDFELIKEVIGSYVELGKTHKSRSLVGPSLLMHLRQGSNTFAFTSWHSMLLWHLKWILMTIFG
ncbi:Cullin-1 [Tyrophagus putrescentiae]|nr:Cullin-1 [Tyrophagus putrescentiae]